MDEVHFYSDIIGKMGVLVFMITVYTDFYCEDETWQKYGKITTVILSVILVILIVVVGVKLFNVFW